MKVLFVTPVYPTAVNPVSGIFISELEEALRHTGIEVRVAHMASHVIWPFSLLTRYSANEKETDENESILLMRQRTSALPRALGIILFAEIRGRRLARNVRRTWPDFHPDIVHAHTIIPGLLSAKAVAKAYKCALVATTHGADTRVWLKRTAGRRAILNACRQNVPIICVSDKLKQELVRAGATTDNLFVIPNGMDFNKVHTGQNHLSDKYAGMTVILGVGNLKHTKGFDLFLHAMAMLRQEFPSIRGVIVGDGVERQKLINLHRNLKLDGIVDIVGAKDPLETMAYMDACDIFCLPSWSEGFGIVYLEAMAHGKPVVAVEGEGISEIVREHKAGVLVAPRNAQDVAQKLKSLIIDPINRNRMGEVGRQAVIDLFSWHHCARNTINSYHQAMIKFNISQKNN